MSDEPAYDRGGYLPASDKPMTVTIHPDECVINLAAQCQRAAHPTATSDCVTQRWIGRRQ